MKGKDLGILLVKIVLLAVVLMIVNGIGSRFLPAAEAEGTGQISEAVVESAPAPPSGSFMAIVLIVMLLQTVALAYPVIRSKWSGWKLALTVFLLYFGTVTFLSQIESLVYLGGKMPNGMLLGLFAMGFFTAAVFSPIAVLVLGKWKAETAASATSGHREPASAREWLLRPRAIANRRPRENGLGKPLSAAWFSCRSTICSDTSLPGRTRCCVISTAARIRVASSLR